MLTEHLFKQKHTVFSDIHALQKQTLFYTPPTLKFQTIYRPVIISMAAGKSTIYLYPFTV